MGLRAGELRDRVQLQRATRTPDGSGGYQRAWGTIATLWARAVPSGGTERLVAGSLRSKQGWSVTIRYRDDITIEDRFMLGTKILAIASIEDTDRTREKLVALCETGTDG